MKKYPQIRRTRGDGNCFYRAFAFGYLEHNRNNPEELSRFRRVVGELKDQLVKLNYSAYTVEDLQDVVFEIIDLLRQGSNEQVLMESFCNQSYSDYFVAYLRSVSLVSSSSSS